MALVIETGSSSISSNSYVTVEECKAYASLRGFTLPSTDPEIEVLIIKANDYLESLTFKGEKTDSSQALEFPREGLVISGDELSSDTIPEKLKQAQCRLAFEAVSTDLLPTGNGREVLREKVDVLEVQYAEKGTSVDKPTFTSVDSLLKDFISGASTRTGAALKTLRV